MPTMPAAAPLAETQATRLSDTAPVKTSPKKPKKKGRSWLLISFLGLLGLILIAAASGFGGYLSGVDLRKQAEATQKSVAARDQYERALQDIDQGAYANARKRLEYVIGIDPNYPGAVDTLANVLMEMSTTATPTVAPEPTLTPTPDMRGVEELYSQAQQAVLNGEWQPAIDALTSLRLADPEYKPVDVDGMFFVAFRNLGRDLILVTANLEEGIYQLTLATRFGLLDAEAQSLLNWSSLYIKGASFWELDWGQATFYFAQVAPYAPNLRDGSGMTAVQRYQEAIVHYVEKLMNERNWCEAKAQAEIALTMIQTPELQNAYLQSSERCGGQPGGGGDNQPTQPSP